MKTPFAYSILAAAAACGLANAQTAYTTPVGYVTIPIPGTGGVPGVTQKLQLANQGLLPPAAVEYTGVAESITSTYVEDTQGTWAAGAYVRAGSLGAMISHLVEITDGPLQGTMTWVTSSTSSQGVGQRLYTSDDISAAGNTASFRVLKCFTISSLFGTTPTSAALGGAGTITAADTVKIIDPLGTPQTFWYKNSGGSSATWGWKIATLPAGVGAADVPHIAIHPNDGLQITRKRSDDGSLVISGDVKTLNTKVRVEGSQLTASVFNLIAYHHPAGGLTIGATGLYTGNAATGIKGAGTISAADLVQIWNPSTGSFQQFWYKNSGGSSATWGWKTAGPETISVPANYVIPSTAAILITRKSGNPFTWNIPAVSIAP
jgi:hypothetical protein